MPSTIAGASAGWRKQKRDEMKYLDDLETRLPEVRERALMRALGDQIAHAKKHAPYFTRVLKDIQPHEIRDRASLARLPVTRKSDLLSLQKDDPPFGGMAGAPPARRGRAVSSPGPRFAPPGAKRGCWGIARALFC